MPESDIHGAFAEVSIRFDGSLRELAERVAKAFELTEIVVEPDEYEPHDDIGTARALGWVLWLAAETESGSFNLRMETTDCFQEIFDGRMHDLSPWLARFLSHSRLAATPTPGRRGAKR